MGPPAGSSPPVGPGVSAAIVRRCRQLCYPACVLYRVRVRYREPTFASRLGVERVYSASFLVAAGNPAEATAAARREFRAIEVASSVSWTREIVSVEVQEVDHDQDTAGMIQVNTA